MTKNLTLAIAVGWLAMGLGPASSQDAVSPEVARNASGTLAEASRQRFADMTFEEFRDAVLFVEETGKYYVNGDEPIRNEKLLREYWERNIRTKPVPPQGESPEFTVVNVGGLDQIWNGAERLGLSYCVSPAFGGRYQEVIEAMADAAAVWEAAADIEFSHFPDADLACGLNPGSVLFDVRPVNAGGAFFAAAFFPNDPAGARSVVIDPSAFVVESSPGLPVLTLTGILRHELGHVLGARHEHTRPEAGTCFEDSDWRAVTDYDAFSVMHYPHCNGLADWTLRLTATDILGVSCLYGGAGGIGPDPGACGTPTPAARPRSTQTFGPGTLPAGDFRLLGMIEAEPATRMTVAMTGTGDPDLYIKVNGPPLRSNFDCRPFVDGADETCDFEVPADAQFIGIGVHGFTDGTFEVLLEYTEK